MSRPLQYSASCAECGRPMRSGTLADFFDDGKGGYSYIHSGSCPSDAPPAKPTTKRRAAEHDAYVCPHCNAGWCFDKGAFARGRGKRAPVCPSCHEPWDDLFGLIEAGQA